MRWKNKLSWIVSAAFALAVMAAPLAAAPSAHGITKVQQDQTTTTAKTKKTRKKKSKTAADSASDQSTAATPATTTKSKRSRSKKSAAAASESAAAPATESSSSAAAKMASRGHAGAGQVWVNTGTGTFHYEGSKFYGKTKQGKYMSESDALKAGYHAAKNEKKPGSGQE